MFSWAIWTKHDTHTPTNFGKWLCSIYCATQIWILLFLILHKPTSPSFLSMPKAKQTFIQEESLCTFLCFCFIFLFIFSVLTFFFSLLSYNKKIKVKWGRWTHIITFTFNRETSHKRCKLEILYVNYYF